MVAPSIVKSRYKITGGLVAGAVTSGVLASAGLGLAPTASATCASVFGIGNSADCTSTLFGAAIAIGDGAAAHSTGLFGAAFAVGANSSATTSDAFTLATAVGSNTSAAAHGLFGLALSIGGNDNTVDAGASGSILKLATNFFGSNNEVTVQGGVSNRATNIAGNNNDLSVGGPGSNLNFVLNVGGGDSTISAGGPGNLNAGLNFFGTNNGVAAGPGPLALAASVLQDGQTVTKTNPGIAINNFRVGGTALTRGPSGTVPKAQAGPVSKIGVGGRKTVNAAGATTVSDKKK